jgi:hypothetical protein
MAGETRSKRATAPSAASTGSFLATFWISATAWRIRVMAGWDFQPKAWRRKRALNAQEWALDLVGADGAGRRPIPELYPRGAGDESGRGELGKSLPEGWRDRGRYPLKNRVDLAPLCRPLSLLRRRERVRSSTPRAVRRAGLWKVLT